MSVSYLIYDSPLLYIDLKLFITYFIDYYIIFKVFLEMEYHRNEQNEIIITIDGVSYMPNDDLEFTLNNGKTCVLFACTVSTRTHTTVADYKDHYMQIPAVILKDDAMEIIQSFVNISMHTVKFSSVPVNATFSDAIDSLKTSLINLGYSTVNKAKAAQNSTDRIQQDDLTEQIVPILTSLLNNVNLNAVGVLAGEPKCIDVVTDGMQCSRLLSYIMEHIHLYTSYDESMLQNHSINTAPYLLNSIVRIITLDRSIIQSNLFTTSLDIITHYLIAVLFDMVTDKCSKVLYIERKNQAAADLVARYVQNYPQLLQIRSAQDLGKLPPNFWTQIGLEPIQLNPYILAYRFDDKQRILFCYEQMIQQINQIDSNINWFSPIEFWNLLEAMSNNMDASLYKIDDAGISNLMPKLFEIIQSMKHIDPVVNKLADASKSFL